MLELNNFLPTNYWVFQMKPLKAKPLAGEQKATEFRFARRDATRVPFAACLLQSESVRNEPLEHVEMGHHVHFVDRIDDTL